MKKLLYLFLLFSGAVYGQYPNTQYIATTKPNTLILPRDAFGSKGFVNITFTDTTAANANPYLKYYTGAHIVTSDGVLWVRVGDKWVKQLSSANFTETDPIFSASPSFGITGGNISNWNTAYGWGNHAGLYWGLNGNSINPATDFLGTTSNHSLRIKTNNSTRMELDSVGYVLWKNGTVLSNTTIFPPSASVGVPLTVKQNSANTYGITLTNAGYGSGGGALIAGNGGEFNIGSVSGNLLIKTAADLYDVSSNPGGITLVKSTAHVLVNTATDGVYNFDVNGTARVTGNVTGNANLTLTTTPATSASTYDIITRNTSTGVFEKVPLNTFENPLTFSTGLTRTTNTITNNLSTGVSGGQTVIGGTGSGENLTLSSTSHATKGKILFGTSGYDEVNNRLGLKIATPLKTLDVRGNTIISGTTGGYVGASTDPSNFYTLSLQNNAAANYIEFLDNGGIDKGAFLGLNANDFEIYNYQGGDIIFYADPTASTVTERLRISKNGNIGVNTAAPASKLDILPTGTFAAAGVSGITTRAHTVTLSGSNPTTYATFRANEIGRMTLVGTNAGQTVTDASSLTIIGAPVKSTNVAVTNTHAIRIASGAVSTATNSFGLTVNAQTGATNNYAGQFIGGNTGFQTATPNSTVQVNGSFAFAYVAKTTTYTATASDYTIDCTSGTFTVTLPTAVGIAGRVYIIKNSGAGVITMAGTSGQTFDGVASPTLAAEVAMQYQSNNVAWIKIN